ncbi:MAG TPA: sulfotransferase domain-containing protein [Balneolaceae bacterium]|nr:sulfotransferase domain-containing protein [Balneolaceae bacterium]
MLIHIGYVKTASTFLQKRLFIEEVGFKKVGKHVTLRDYLVKPQMIHYEKAKIEEYLKSELNKAGNKNLAPVMTFERLSGNPISGGYDQVIICNRLKELFPEAKILIVFREQSDLLVSSYKQVVQEGFSGSIKQYIYPPKNGAKIPQFNLKFLEYSHLIKLYQNKFGNNNTLALQFELMKENPARFFSLIFKFCQRSPLKIDTERKINKSIRPLQVLLKSFANAFFTRDQTNPNPIISNTRYSDRIIYYLVKLIPEFVDADINNKYKKIARGSINNGIRKDNSLLERNLKIDLQNFGYELYNNSRRI